jgi:hypothetical protein
MTKKDLIVDVNVNYSETLEESGRSEDLIDQKLNLVLLQDTSWSTWSSWWPTTSPWDIENYSTRNSTGLG